jgi:zinc transporter ZupT
MTNTILTLSVALLFAAVHLFSARLSFLASVPRSRWLSFGGGVSVAYVFAHLLPELAERGAELAREAQAVREESVIFLIALAGLVLFYGLERLAKSSARLAKQTGGEGPMRPGVFWLHIAAFALYNGLIGYLLVHREDMDLRGLVIYAIALGLHFIVNDRGLEEHHGPLYARYGRWLIAAAVLAGWGFGAATEVDAVWLAGLFAFLAGGIVLNVLKEELPEERESRFSAFLLGAGAYVVLLRLI